MDQKMPLKEAEDLCCCTWKVPNGFPCLDTDQNKRDLARLEKSVKKHEPLEECSKFFQSRATPQVLGSQYPNKGIHLGISLVK